MSQSPITTPVLKRILSRGDLILYGLVILTPTAPYPVYGIVQQTSHGHAALSYLVAMVAMLFTAASYGKMSGVFPSAGSTYAYVQNALNPHIGFLAGWSMILDYFLIPLLSIIYAALTANRLAPQVPYWVWAVSFAVAITLVNVRGIRVTAQAGNVMMTLMTICAVLFVALAARWVVLRHGVAGLIVPEVFTTHRRLGLRPLMLGAAIASISYIGFDAISTLAEDTIHPERDISFATILVCLIQTVFCVATVYLAALVWPDYHSYPESETVILDIGRRAGGPWLMGFLTFILLGRRTGERAYRTSGRVTATTRHGTRRRNLTKDLCACGCALLHSGAQRVPDGRRIAGRLSVYPVSIGGGTPQLRGVRRIHPGEPQRDPSLLCAGGPEERYRRADEPRFSAGGRAGMLLCVVESECEGAGGRLRLAGSGRDISGCAHPGLPRSAARAE